MEPIVVEEINSLQRFARSLRYDTDPSIVRAKLTRFLEVYGIHNFILGQGSPIFRARRCRSEKGFASLNDLIYPPRDITTVGRLNSAGDPIMYGSLRKETALEEIDVQEGELIQLVVFRIKKDTSVRCCIVGEVDRVQKMGRSLLSEELGNNINNLLRKMPLNAGMSFIYADAFASSLLRDPDASANDYLYSRTLREVMFNKIPGLGAMFYLSIKTDLAINTAVLPQVVDNDLEVMGTSVVQINKKFDFNLYDFSILRNATKFGPNREILWD